ncbi:MAG: hypothetical protein PVJ34_16825 [Anaerolineae bacterium]|jgi:hypothetical protein
MSKTMIDGLLVNPGAAKGTEKLIHTGEGRIYALIISHAEVTAQKVVLYDDTSAQAGDEILVLWIAPERCPVFYRFPRSQSIHFTDGLYIDNGNCEVAVWGIGY